LGFVCTSATKTKILLESLQGDGGNAASAFFMWHQHHPHHHSSSSRKENLPILQPMGSVENWGHVHAEDSVAAGKHMHHKASNPLLLETSSTKNHRKGANPEPETSAFPLLSLLTSDLDSWGSRSIDSIAQLPVSTSHFLGIHGGTLQPIQLCLVSAALIFAIFLSQKSSGCTLQTNDKKLTDEPWAPVDIKDQVGAVEEEEQQDAKVETPRREKATAKVETPSTVESVQYFDFYEEESDSETTCSEMDVKSECGSKWRDSPAPVQRKPSSPMTIERKFEAEAMSDHAPAQFEDVDLNTEVEVEPSSPTAMSEPAPAEQSHMMPHINLGLVSLAPTMADLPDLPRLTPRGRNLTNAILLMHQSPAATPRKPQLPPASTAISDHLPSQLRTEKLGQVEHPLILTDVPCLTNTGAAGQLSQATPLTLAAATGLSASSSQVKQNGVQTAGYAPMMDSVWFDLHTVNEFMDVMGAATECEVQSSMEGGQAVGTEKLFALLGGSHPEPSTTTIG